jgi:PAS domain S-box-containing protein
MKVLIVDDNIENIYLLETVLTGHGYAVDSVSNGTEALKKLEKGGFKLIISDILMPVMDGFQLCRLCKEDKRLRDIPFIFYTATYTDKKDEQFALKLGADKFIRKPMAPDKLIKIIKYVLKNAGGGKVKQKKSSAKKSEDVFKLYSERLVTKLEKKMLDLEAELNERKKAEEALQQSEARYRRVSELISDYAYSYCVEADNSLILEWITNAFTRITGFTPEESEARGGWAKLLHPDDLPVALQRAEKLFSGKKDVSEFRIITKSGEVHWLRDYGIPEFSKKQGRVIRIIGAAQDITERKRADEALKQASIEWQKTFDATLDGVCLLDKDHKIQRCNWAMSQIFGKDLEEIVGKHCWEIVHGTSKPILQCPVFRMEKSLQRESMELPVGEKWFDVTVDPLTDEAGSVVGTVHIVRDITLNKEAEHALQQSVQEMIALKVLGIQVNSNLSHDLFVQAALNGIVNLANPDLAILFLREEDKLFIRGEKYKYPKLRLKDTSIHKVGECLCGLAVSEKNALYSKNIKNDPRCTLEEKKTAGLISFAALPLLNGEEIIGVLGLASGAERDFSKQATFLETASNEIAIGLQNAIFYQKQKDNASRLEREISERKQIEEKLRKSEEKFHSIFESASDGILNIDRNAIVLDANTAFTEITGISSETVIGKSGLELVKKFVTAKELPEVLKIVNSIIANKTSKPFELKYEEKILEISTKGKQKDGRIVGLIRDITERKRIEKERAHNLNLMLSLNHAARNIQRTQTPEVVYRVIGEQLVKLGFDVTVLTLSEDKKHLITSYLSLNPKLVRAAERLTGLSTEGYRIPLTKGGYYHQILFEGKTIFSNLDKKPFVEALPRKLRPLVGKLRDLFNWKQSIIAPLAIDDEVKGLLSVTGSELTESDIQGIMAFANQAAIAIENAHLYETSQQELAERKQAEEELRYQADLLENVSDAIISTDSNFNIRSWNKAAEIIYGWQAVEVIGKQMSNVTKMQYNVGERDALVRELTEQGYWKGEVVQKRKNGSSIHILASVTLIKDSTGNPIGTVAVNRDITHRKQIEETLNREKEYLEKLHNSLGDAVFSVKMPQRVIEYVNVQAEAIFGYKSNECIGRSTELFYPNAEEYQNFGKVLKTIIEKGSGRFITEQLLKRRNGEVFPTEITTTFLKENGNIRRVISIVKDITERKQIENKLHENQVFLKSILESSQLGIFVVDVIDEKKFIYKYINPTHEILSGVRADQIIGKSSDTLREFYDEKTVQLVNDLYNQCVQTRQSIEMEHSVQIDGEETWWFSKITPLINEQGQVHQLTGNALLITERKQAEDKRLESERKLINAQRLAQIGSWQWDVQTGEVEWTEEVFRIFGLDPEEFHPRIDSVMNRFHPDDRKIQEELIKQAITNRELYSFESRILLPGDQIRFLRSTSEGHFDENDKLIRISGTVQNVTERKQAEEDLLKTTNQLRSLAAHLHSIREEERTAIAREIHDEFGQVLSALKMNLTAIERKLQNGEKRLNRQEIIDELNDSKDIIAHTVKDVRRLITELRPDVLDLHGLLAALQWQNDEFSSRTNIVSELFSNVDDVNFDQDINIAVFRIFQEALNNIAKHAKATKVRIDIKKQKKEFVLKIKDDGIGFDLKISDKKQTFGLLGMRERTLLCGGEMDVISKKGKGTELQFKIPLGK